MNVRAVARLMAVLALAGGGCRTGYGPGDPVRVVLPRWFSAPQGEEQAQTPVAMGMGLPPHLADLRNQYPLPDWAIYGVVRCLGAQEFLVNGTYRRFSMSNESGEANVVVDDLHYDVSIDRIREELKRLSAEAATGETERERLNALSAHVRRRWGSFLLYGLSPAGGGEGANGQSRNRLLESGATADSLEAFEAGQVPMEMPRIGLRETAEYYENVFVGEFRYGDPLGAFRRTEEEAIHDLARSLVVKFSHL